MRNASPGLIALLNSSTEFVMADLYTFTLLGGDMLYYSGGQTALGSYILGPKFERTMTKFAIGANVDDLQVMVYPKGTDLIGSTPWLQAVWQGQFDGATLEVDRAFMAPYPNIVGTVTLFTGRVSDLNCSRTAVQMSCKSHLELLNIPMPRRIVQASCNHVFGGAMCQFDRAAFALSFSAAAGSTSTTIYGVPNVTSGMTYAQGTIIANSGPNAGQQRMIYTFTNASSVFTKLAFLSAPDVSDSYTILPGCDRQMLTCKNVMNNLVHFGGFPFVPASETAVGV